MVKDMALEAAARKIDEMVLAYGRIPMLDGRSAILKALETAAHAIRNMKNTTLPAGVELVSLYLASPLAPAEGESAEPDWQLAAMRDTVGLINAGLETAAFISPTPESLSPGHIRDMLVAMERGINPQDTERGFSKAKRGRWLGWAQAAVVAMGLGTLDDMRCSAVSRPTPSGEKG